MTRLDALRTGELAPIEETAVAQHLERCKSCDDSRHDVESLLHAVKALAPAPPRSCREEVRQAVADSVDRVDTAAGPVWVAFSAAGVRMVVAGDTLDVIRPLYAKRFGRALETAPIPAALRRQVVAAIAGQPVEAPRVDLGEANDLEHDVLRTLARIPRGQVRTYAWVARQAGRPRAVRAVANVIARNAVPFLVPCHRVVPSSGGVGQYLFGSAMKRSLLAREGVDVEELDQLARAHVRYIGSKTTHVFCFPTCSGARRILDENRVPFRDADDALESGFRPCRLCQPVAA